MPSILVAALQLVPLIVQAGEDIDAFVTWAIKVYNQPGGPAAADWDALEEKESAIRAVLVGPVITAAQRPPKVSADPAPAPESTGAVD